jgi:hypothetical protein
MVYEEGFLRYLTLGETEVLRMLYFAVRDHNWDTIPCSIAKENIEEGPEGFVVRYQCLCERLPEIQFVWDCEIRGDASGKVEFSIEGEAQTSFLKNRIGFCILHPVEGFAGKTAQVVQTNGAVAYVEIPTAISPHQPVFDMREIRWEVTPGCMAHLLMEGEVFEMEDQRNWTDASFKTYCTPLGLPFPVAVQRGEKVTQKITLQLQGEIPGTAKVPEQGVVTVQVGWKEQPLPLPMLGIGQSSETLEPTATDLKSIASLQFGFYHALPAELYAPGWEKTLLRAFHESYALSLPLLLSFVFDDDYEKQLVRLKLFQEDKMPYVMMVQFFHARHKSTPPQLLEHISAGLRDIFQEVKIGAGTQAYFAELNRFRVDPAKVDYLTFSVNPQVHAFDLLSLTETLAAQQYVVASTQAFSGGKPVVVGPVTLKPRFNPNATGPAPAVLPGELPPQVDVRQVSAYAAGWTLGSVRNLAQAGAYAVSYYQTFGMQGIMQSSKAGEILYKFPAFPGMKYPVYFIFRKILSYKNTKVLPLLCSHPLQAEGLVLQYRKGITVILANLTDRRVQIRVTEFPTREASLTYLNGAVLQALAAGELLPDALSVELVQPQDGQLMLELPPFGMIFAEVDLPVGW